MPALRPTDMPRAGTLQGILLLLPMTMAVMGLVVLVPVLPQLMAHFHAVPGVEYLVPLMLTLPALCVAVLAPVAMLRVYCSWPGVSAIMNLRVVVEKYR